MVVKEKEVGRLRLRGCKRCGGDMYNEGEGWKCLQCSREVKARGFKVLKYTTGRKVKWE